MANNQLNNNVIDVLEARRNEWSNLAWVTRSWNPTVAFKKYQRVKPEILKHNVLNSERLAIILEKLATEQHVPVNELHKNAKILLNEIGFSKDINVIRALAALLIKMLKRMCFKLYLSIDTISQLKSQMGHNPVIFLPSHRSYADFILMSYVCFTTDIEIPAIAAGMDFHGMWGMGSVLRDTGAFFMRRQFVNDRLYSNVFAEYMRELVVNGDLPIEFFIEGTRSRSLKSLSPKFGLLTMVLKPLFFGEVPDITIVPISINYERVMEENLFANELLGVPKPKESTKGLFKALNIVNEKYGNIIFNFAPSISAKEYFGTNLNRKAHILGSVNDQTLTDNEMEQIIHLGYDIVRIQQTNCILNAFNLIAFILNTNIIDGGDAINFDQLKTSVLWLKNIFEKFGATINFDCVEDTLNRLLEVHKNLIVRTDDNLIKIVKSVLVFNNNEKRHLKGHDLKSETMNDSLPLVKLQLYANPTMHFVVGRAITALVLGQYSNQEKGLRKDEIWNQFQWLRRLFAFEFVIYKDRERMEFEESIQNLEELDVITQTRNEEFIKGVNSKLYNLLCNSLSPFIVAYDTICEVLIQFKTECYEKEIFCAVQRRVEEILNDTMNKFIHPYALSLDTISTALLSLTTLNGLKRYKRDNLVCYTPINQVLTGIRCNLESHLKILMEKNQSTDNMDTKIKFNWVAKI